MRRDMMPTRFPVFRLTILAAAAGVAIVLPPQAAPAPRVSIHVGVVDAMGRPVTDLQAADFEVRDSGTPRPVEAFLPTVPLRSVVVLLDVSASMSRVVNQLLDAAEAVLRGLPPQDRVRLGTFSRSLQLGPVITGSRLDAIRSLRQGLKPAGPSALYDAVASSMEAMAGETGRRVVLVLTDGLDTNSRRGFPQVIEPAQRDDQAVFSMAFRDTSSVNGVPVSQMQRAHYRALMRLAAETGGVFVEWNGGRLNHAVERLIGELRSEYKLEFTPVDRRAYGNRHKLQVVVKRTDVRVRAREYFVIGS
jgi:Ca-activated chloride channel homolog